MDFLRKFGDADHVGRISVTIHPDDFPTDGVIDSLLEEDPDGVRLRENIRVLVIDGNHRHEAMLRLRLDQDPKYDWIRYPVWVFITTRVDGKPMSSLEISKSSKLLNTLSAHFLPCVAFQDVWLAVIQYAHCFERTYKVSFLDA